MSEGAPEGYNPADVSKEERAKRFVWEKDDLEFLTPEEAHQLLRGGEQDGGREDGDGGSDGEEAGGGQQPYGGGSTPSA